MNGRFNIVYVPETKTFSVERVNEPGKAFATFSSMYAAEEWAKRENERIDGETREQAATRGGDL